MDALHFAATKVQPPRLRVRQVERPALHAAVAAALVRCRVVLLQAPAGFGKTSVLAAQLAALPADWARAWVSLDPDDDAERLAACLTAALEPWDLPWRTAPEALVSLAGGEPAAQRRAVAEIVNALADADAPHGLIVLDDLHRVQEPGALALLSQLAERLPSQWTLLLASRTAPPLAPLARLRAAGELAEFDQTALRFSDDEARALCAAESVAAARTDELVARGAGWPAALRLAALGGSRASAAQAEGHVFDYLASEVLDGLPPALHDFLLRTSVLPELTASRAAAVSGDARAAEWLDEIERRGLFATALDAHERTLVLHDLFRDALAARLRRQLPAERPGLLQRAATTESDPVRRVGYLQQAADWPAADAALADVAEGMLLDGRSRELLRLVDAFPEAERSAGTAAVAAAASMQRWQWPEARRWCEAGIRTGQARGDAAGTHHARARLATVLYAMDRNPEAEALLAALDADATLPPRVRVLALVGDMYQHFRRGEHARLVQLLARLLDTLEGSGAGLMGWWEGIPAINWSTIAGMPPLFRRYLDGAWRRLGDRPLPMRPELHLLQACLQLWDGRVAESEATLATARADMQWLAITGELVNSIDIVTALIDAMRGRAAAVHANLEAKIAREADAPEPRRRLWEHQNAVYGVRLSDTLGDADGLAYWAGRLREDPLRDPAPQVARAVAARARWAAAQRRWDDAAALFDQLMPQLPRLDVMGQRTDLTLRAAHAFLHAGRPDDAAGAAAGVADRMLAEGVRGHALLCGPALLRTLADARWGARLTAPQRAELQAAAALAESLREAATPPTAEAVAAAPAVAGPLSEREREVLERIAAGDSNKLIARALDISPHTVKRHVANILDKLGLASRGQAGAWLRDHA